MPCIHSLGELIRAAPVRAKRAGDPAPGRCARDACPTAKFSIQKKFREKIAIFEEDIAKILPKIFQKKAPKWAFLSPSKKFCRSAPLNNDIC